MKAKRPLTRDDREVWSAVTRGVNPYHGARLCADRPPHTGVAKPRAVLAPRIVGTPARATPSAKPSAFEAGDPKLDRRAARGRIAIDATLDLHGFTQAAAHLTLQQFFATARARHYRCVLIVTGKGARKDGGGILRRRFLDWVEERDMRDHITRVSPAHQRHGGAGAFYVFLRSATRQTR